MEVWSWATQRAAVLPSLSLRFTFWNSPVNFKFRKDFLKEPEHLKTLDLLTSTAPFKTEPLPMWQIWSRTNIYWKRVALYLQASLNSSCQYQKLHCITLPSSKSAFCWHKRASPSFWSYKWSHVEMIESDVTSSALWFKFGIKQEEGKKITRIHDYCVWVIQMQA